MSPRLFANPALLARTTQAPYRPVWRDGSASRRCRGLYPESQGKWKKRGATASRRCRWPLLSGVGDRRCARVSASCAAPMECSWSPLLVDRLRQWDRSFDVGEEHPCKSTSGCRRVPPGHSLGALSEFSWARLRRIAAIVDYPRGNKPCHADRNVDLDIASRPIPERQTGRQYRCGLDAADGNPHV